MEHDGPGPLLRASILLAACGLILAAPLTGYYGLSRLLGEAATLHWPSTPGKVTKSVVAQTDLTEDHRFRPDIYYSYQVAGKSYDSHGVFVDDRTYATPEEAALVRDGYPLNSEQSIYYEPANPGRTVLVPGTTDGAWLWTFSPFPLAALGALLMWLWLVVRKDLKRKKLPHELDI